MCEIAAAMALLEQIMLYSVFCLQESSSKAYKLTIDSGSCGELNSMELTAQILVVTGTK